MKLFFCVVVSNFVLRVDRRLIETLMMDMDAFIKRLYEDQERLESRVETPLPHTMEESRTLNSDFQVSQYFKVALFNKFEL